MLHVKGLDRGPVGRSRTRRSACSWPGSNPKLTGNTLKKIEGSHLAFAAHLWETIATGARPALTR